MLKKKRKAVELIQIIIGLAVMSTLALGVFVAISNSMKANNTSVINAVNSDITGAISVAP